MPAQKSSISLVPFDVVFDLFQPILFWQSLFPFRKPISVPKIAINEYRDLFSWDCNIRGPDNFLIVLLKMNLPFSQLSEQQNFYLRALRPNARHDFAPLLFCEPIHKLLR